MGMTAAKLADRTAVNTVGIVAISVTDENKRRAAAAANALADVLLERISEGVDEKIAVLEQQLADGKAALEASVERSSAAQATVRALVRENGGRADSAVAATYGAIAQAAANEQQVLVAANQKIELMLVTATQVERPQILHEAAAPSEPSGPKLARNVSAGALAGLVIGVIVVFARRRRLERARPPATTT